MLSPLASVGAGAYAIAWPIAMLGTYTGTTVYRFARYMNMTVPQTVSEAVKRIRQDWRKALRASVPLITVITVSYAAYRIWKYAHRDKIETQGSKVSLPLPRGISERQDPYRPPAIAIPVVNVDLKTATCDQMCGVILQKLVLLRFKKGDTYVEHCCSLPLCTGYWFVPMHILEKNYDAVDIVKTDTLHNNAVRTAKLQGAWRRIGRTDFALLYLPVMGDQRDLRRLLPSGDSLEAKSVGASCVWLKAEREKVSETETFLKLHRGQFKTNFSTAIVKPHNLGYTYPGGEYMSSIETWNGMCGSVLITDATGPMIAGLHSAGMEGTKHARTCTILRRDADECIAAMTGPDTSQLMGVQSGDFRESLNFVGTPFGYTTEQRPKSTSSFVAAGGFDFLGCTTAPHRTMRSIVKPTVIAELVCKHLQTTIQHGPPAYISHWGPWNAWVTAMSKPSDIPSHILDVAYNDYKQHILDGWQPDWCERISPMAEDAVLAGIDGLQGCYKMNMTSSMGIPYCKPKGNFLPLSDRQVENISCPRDMPQFLRDEIAQMEKTLAEGLRVYSPHRCTLKDEPTRLDKDKCRVFMGSAFAYQFLMRKYFLMISIIIQEHPELFESCVGIKAMSLEWTRLYKHVFKYGKKITIAGDFGKYDQKLDIKVMFAFFKILIWMCERSGYSEFQLAVCRGLATETCMAVFEVRNEWLQFNCGNSSGNPLTVVLNGGCNSLYMRSAKIALQPKGCQRKFAELVALITYGDDNTMTVAEEAPWFNHTAVSQCLASWGMDYTMADKDSLSVPYIDGTEAEFLKRRWVWSDKYNRYLCPLREPSILKSLTCAKKSDTLTNDQLAAQIVLGANMEYWFHGEQVFRKRNKELTAVLEEANIIHHLPGCRLKNFEELEEWYLNNN